MTVQIDIDFPGGNIIVEKIEGSEITLQKDLRDTATDWFYWAFRCRFPEQGRYHFRITNGYVCGPRGPAVSYDDGFTWEWLGAESITSNNTYNNEFAYTAEKDGVCAIFCFGMQYQQKHLDHFLARHQRPYLTVSTHAVTKKGRQVERLHIEDGSDGKKHILFAARHHCCEMMANYVLEGILAEILSDSETGKEFRKRYIVDAIPFMDKDGVVDGDQGKNRIPHDHARDYGQTPNLYPEIAATEKLVQENKPFFILDLHCPWIHTGENETISFPGPPDKEAERNMLRFSGILEKLSPPEAPHYSKDNVLFGTGWNTNANYTAGMPLGKWALKNLTPKPMFGGTLEVAYANAGEITLYPDSCRKLGSAVAKAILEFDDGL